MSQAMVNITDWNMGGSLDVRDLTEVNEPSDDKSAGTDNMLTELTQILGADGYPHDGDDDVESMYRASQNNEYWTDGAL